MDFNNFLILFKPDKEFETRLGAAQRQWDECSLAKQQAIINWLETHGAYHGRNPYFFIQDFKIRAPAQHPTNYRGKAIPHGLQIFSAKYNGAWGMYTQEDIDRFSMTKYTPN